MAYDQNAPYQPPRRAYYGQTQPEAPAQPSYENYQDRQYYEYGQQEHGGHRNRDHYNEYDGCNQTPHDEQRWNDHGGYQGAYDQGAYQEQSQQTRDDYHPRERGYDTRFQQRGPKPPQERQGYQIQPSNRPPRSEHPDPMGEGRAQFGRPGPGPRMNGHGERHRGPQHEQGRVRDYPNNAAADWKAKEKAKMQASAVSPDYLPQDTAFPKLGNKSERPRTSQGRNSGASSEDQRRPGSGHPDGRAPRPAEPRERGSGRERSFDGVPSQTDRPSTANASSKGYRAPPNPMSGNSGYHRQAPMSQEVAGYTDRPADNYEGQQWPLGNLRTPATSRAEQQVPPHGYRSRVEEIPRAQSTRPSNEYAQRPHHQQEPNNSQKSGRTHPALHPIDTSNRPSGPAFGEHSSLGPVDVIRRPATASGARSVPVHQMASPALHAPQSATVENYASPKPWMQHSHSASLDDLYDGYGATSDSNPELPRTREEEIEAEMPDFTSSAPTQTSGFHKRTQTVDRHLDDHSAAASQPPVRSTQPHYHGYQDQGYRQQQETSLQPDPNFPGARLQQTHSNPEYSRQGTGPPMGQRSREGNRPAPGRDRHDNQYLPPDRSQTMDETRQVPHRPAQPSNQRFYQQASSRDNAQPAPPQARPGFDRAATDQSTWSDPGQQRMPGAHPGGQGQHQRPNMGGPRVPIGRPADARQHRNSDPDGLPHHPAPVRPGLLDQAQSQPAKPPPMRSYANVDRNTSVTAPQGRPSQNPEDPFARPVTREELDRLRAEVEANPNNPKRALIFAKKLIEAATVLANEGGRLDQKTAAKNRERYTMEGYKRVKKLVNSGYPEAQFYLADCYGQGMLGLEIDTKEAFSLYQAAAKQGHGQAAYRTAVCCEMGPEEGGGTRRDYPKAVQWYRRAAALGDNAAMFKLGAVLLKGLLGQPRNVGEAVTWLKRAADRADNDNPHSLHELASLYESSNADPEVRNKVVADDAYARDLYQRAAKLGYKFSQFRLGQAYEYGALGLTIDNRQSITWYTKAAAQGEHHAELALSGWYLTGAEGILEHSDTEAYLWARKAAMSEPPLANALFAMGYFTEEGIGCPASLEEAKKWYGRAASQKFPKALERLEALKKNGGKKPAPANGRITRRDQKRDESECVVM